MRDREPTIRSRELGDGLRRAIEQAGLNGKQAAHLLGLSPSWVSRLLSGKRSATEMDVAAILGVCRVKGKERGIDEGRTRGATARSNRQEVVALLSDTGGALHDAHGQGRHLSVQSRQLGQQLAIFPDYRTSPWLRRRAG